MKTIAIATVSLLILSAAFLGRDQVPVAGACPSTNSASLASDTRYVNPDGSFLFISRARWDTKTTPFIGTVRLATGSTGVADVAYTPAYWFPTSCESGLPILVQGRKTGVGPHVVNSFLQVGPSPSAANSASVMLIP